MAHAQSRRALLSTAALIPLSAIPAAAVSMPSPTGIPLMSPEDAELITICEQHSFYWHATAAHDCTSDGDPRWTALNRAVDAIDAAKPVSLAGLAAKARATKLQILQPDGSEDLDGVGGSWALDLVNDLLRLGSDMLPAPRAEPAGITPLHLPPLRQPEENADPDAALVALGKHLDEAKAAETKAWAEAGPEDDPPGPTAAYERTLAVTRQIEATPAVTLAGLQVKMRALQWSRSGRPLTTDEILHYPRWDNPTTGERLMVSVLADLNAMGKV
jgi:hypothetical protein